MGGMCEGGGLSTAPLLWGAADKVFSLMYGTDHPETSQLQTQAQEN